VSERLRQGLVRTRLHLKKLIAASCDVGFVSLLSWIEVEKSKICNGKESLDFETLGQRKSWKSEDVSKHLRTGLAKTKLHQKKLIAPSCNIGFLSFLVESKAKRASYTKIQEILDFETQGERNEWKREDVSERLRKGPRRTRLHLKKLIAPSYDIGFLGFFVQICTQESKLCNRTEKFGFWNWTREKRLKKWRCVRTKGSTRATTFTKKSSYLPGVISHFCIF
jgi:hypothetical protein